MSAQFLISYAGAYLDIERDTTFATPQRATLFNSEADAWYAAYKANLNPMHCKVVSLDAALAKESPTLRPTAAK